MRLSSEPSSLFVIDRDLGFGRYDDREGRGVESSLLAELGVGDLLRGARQTGYQEERCDRRTIPQPRFDFADVVHAQKTALRWSVTDLIRGSVPLARRRWRPPFLEFYWPACEIAMELSAPATVGTNVN